MTKFYFISDTHGDLPDPQLFRSKSVVVHAGDIGPDTGVESWISNRFTPWLELLDDRGIEFHGTLGNHDFPDRWTKQFNVKRLGIHIDELVWIKDKLFSFTPWTMNLPMWAWQKTEQELDRMFAVLPDTVDVVVSHGPPAGVGDELPGVGHVGSEAVRGWLDRQNHKLFICGHIHEGRGEHALGSNTIWNVACKDGQYVDHLDPARFWMEM